MKPHYTVGRQKPSSVPAAGRWGEAGSVAPGPGKDRRQGLTFGGYARRPHRPTIGPICRRDLCMQSQPAGVSRVESNVRIEDRQLPRRVRELLQGIRNLLRGELQHQLTNTLAEFENQVFRMAEQAPRATGQG